MSFVQGFRSSGTSRSSFALVGVPSAPHTRFLQSPIDWTMSAVPAASRMLPQTPAVQVRCTHSLSAPGQSAATLQSAHFMSALQANVQSALAEQVLPAPHLPQWPPQSMSVSSLFLMPSVQVGVPPPSPPSGPPPAPPEPPPPPPEAPPFPPEPPPPAVPVLTSARSEPARSDSEIPSPVPS